MFAIREDDLGHPQTRGLLEHHLLGMRGSSPPGSVFALDLSGLSAPEVTVWTAWEGERIAGVAALKKLDSKHGELKSMRTAPDMLRKGVAAALLDHVIDVATIGGLKRLSLETGSGTAFEPALALYKRRGFVEGEPFSDYAPSEFNQFLHLELGAA